MSATPEPNAAGCPVMHRFPFERDQPTEPSPVLSELRRNEPVARIQLPSGELAWIITGYDDVKEVLADDRFSCLAAAGPSAPHFVPFVQRSESLLSIDPPEHTQARRNLARGINPAAVERMREPLQAIVDDCLDRMAASAPPVEFISLVATPLSERVMAQLLGVEVDQVRELRDDAAISISEISEAEIDRCWQRIADRLEACLRDKRQNPGDDLLSALLAERETDPLLDDRRLAGIVLSVLTPGVGTPIVQITNGLTTLLHQRDQYAALVEDPGLVPGAVEEMLRYNATVEVDHLRVTTAEATVNGVTIAAGDNVFTSITAADRDERRFPDADRFDVRRDPNPHIGFGYGAHACPGSTLARSLLRMFFHALTRRFPDLALAQPFDSLARRAPGLHSVDLRELQVTWGTARG